MRRMRRRRSLSVSVSNLRKEETRGRWIVCWVEMDGFPFSFSFYTFQVSHLKSTDLFIHDVLSLLFKYDLVGVTELGVMYPLDGTFCLVDCFLFLILNSNKNIHESKRE
ncbi:hypothetical protein HMI54_006722 [Coelomomyces lativittatus]|nr:hypothetical protein HMI54_006722 [Coelomomyces lativittatus]KAJ1512678.1 hypothetical protein HMI55_006142 [Coelomomyces lativittatus]